MRQPGLPETSRPYLAGDLEWVIFSPFLTSDVSSPDLSTLPQSKDIVEQVRADPSELQTFLQKMKRQNMGTYFEYLVFFWLEKLDAVSILGTNLQVQNHIQTLGEFDLLFKFEGKFYHWELAIKFYANTGNGTQEDLWIGPLKKDNLKKKLDRLYDHQLDLPSSPDGRKVLADIGIETIHSSPFVKGMLFDKVPKQNVNTRLPARISADCLLLNWAYIGGFPTIDATHFCLLFKPRWISTILQTDWQKLETISALKAELETRFSDYPYPLMIALGLQNSATIEEKTRLFIMPDTW